MLEPHIQTQISRLGIWPSFHQVNKHTYTSLTSVSITSGGIHQGFCFDVAKLAIKFYIYVVIIMNPMLPFSHQLHNRPLAALASPLWYASNVHISHFYKTLVYVKSQPCAFLITNIQSLHLPIFTSYILSHCDLQLHQARMDVPGHVYVLVATEHHQRSCSVAQSVQLSKSGVKKGDWCSG